MLILAHGQTGIFWEEVDWPILSGIEVTVFPISSWLESLRILAVKATRNALKISNFVWRSFACKHWAFTPNATCWIDQVWTQSNVRIIQLIFRLAVAAIPVRTWKSNYFIDNSKGLTHQSIIHSPNKGWLDFWYAATMTSSSWANTIKLSIHCYYYVCVRVRPPTHSLILAEPGADFLLWVLSLCSWPLKEVINTKSSSFLISGVSAM